MYTNDIGIISSEGKLEFTHQFPAFVITVYKSEIIFFVSDNPRKEIVHFQIPNLRKSANFKKISFITRIHNFASTFNQLKLCCSLS